VLPVVREVETLLASDHSFNHEYLPVAGLPEFRTAAARILVGENSKAIIEGRVSNTYYLGNIACESLRAG